jgi:hypothetical protein
LLCLSGIQELHIGTPYLVIYSAVGESFWVKPSSILSDPSEILSESAKRVKQGVSMFNLVNEFLARFSDGIDPDAFYD